MKSTHPAIFSLLCLSLLIFACSKKETVQVVSPSERLDSLFNTIPDFSGVVLVAERGTPVFYKAFGYKDLDAKTAMDTSSIFELASVSKQFTAMAIMMLAEEGKLQYDDLLETYIPGMPYPRITIRQLLNHTSGLPDYQAMMDQHWDKSKVAGNPEILEYLKKYHPERNAEPGEKYEYSNTGYVLLGSIVEKASGKDFVEFVWTKIFEPLKMTNTNLRTWKEKAQLQNFALGFIWVPERKKYVRADSFPSSDYTIWLGDRKGPGRISSTAVDLLKWDRALYKEEFVKAATLQEAFAPAHLNNDSLSNYGFGWRIEISKLGKVVRHSGGNPGYKTHIIRYIDADKTVILLCNNAHEKFDSLLKGIEAIVTSN